MKIKSFGYAWQGFKEVLRIELNARTHLLATVIALGLSWLLKLDAVRFSLILLAIAIVWIAEIFNTVFELVIDMILPGHSKTAKYAKDIAAAAVLLATVIALVIGAVVFCPILYERLGR